MDLDRKKGSGAFVFFLYFSPFLTLWLIYYLAVTYTDLPLPQRYERTCDIFEASEGCIKLCSRTALHKIIPAKQRTEVTLLDLRRESGCLRNVDRACLQYIHICTPYAVGKEFDSVVSRSHVLASVRH